MQNKRKTQNWEKVKRVKKAFSLKRNLSVKRIIAEKPQKLNFGVIARSSFSARFRASFCGERFARLARLAFGLVWSLLRKSQKCRIKEKRKIGRK